MEYIVREEELLEKIRENTELQAENKFLKAELDFYSGKIDLSKELGRKLTKEEMVKLNYLLMDIF